MNKLRHQIVQHDIRYVLYLLLLQVPLGALLAIVTDNTKIIILSIMGICLLLSVTIPLLQYMKIPIALFCIFAPLPLIVMCHSGYLNMETFTIGNLTMRYSILDYIFIPLYSLPWIYTFIYMYKVTERRNDISQYIVSHSPFRVEYVIEKGDRMTAKTLYGMCLKSGQAPSRYFNEKDKYGYNDDYTVAFVEFAEHNS